MFADMPRIFALSVALSCLPTIGYDWAKCCSVCRARPILYVLAFFVWLTTSANLTVTLRYSVIRSSTRILISTAVQVVLTITVDVYRGYSLTCRRRTAPVSVGVASIAICKAAVLRYRSLASALFLGVCEQPRHCFRQRLEVHVRSAEWSQICMPGHSSS